jgi:dihydrodipicolinate synthase/N-acetylneuraminate lyase
MFVHFQAMADVDLPEIQYAIPLFTARTGSVHVVVTLRTALLTSKTFSRVLLTQ